MNRMAPWHGARLVLDANLLALLVVGLVDPEMISAHKRTRAYVPDDFDLLTMVIQDARSIAVTPNVITEASNLLAQTNERDRTRLLTVLGQIVGKVSERYVRSRDAVAVRSFVRLGLSDAAIITGFGPDDCVLTSDLDLHVEISKTTTPTVNFNHIRTGSW